MLEGLVAEPSKRLITSFRALLVWLFRENLKLKNYEAKTYFKLQCFFRNEVLRGNIKNSSNSVYCFQIDASSEFIFSRPAKELREQLIFSANSSWVSECSSRAL